MDSLSSLQAFSGLKALLTVSMLCYAAYQDLENRELEASVWVPMLLLGVSTLTLELASTTFLETLLKLAQSLTLLTMLLLLGLYGPGDALVLAGICLIHVSTSKPLLQGCLLKLCFPDFSLTVLFNSEILSLTMILSNLVHNLRSRAWNALSRGEPFQKRVFCMLLLRAVGRDLNAPEEHAASRVVFVKQTVPMTLFIFPGYVTALIFGSLLPPLG